MSDARNQQILYLLAQRRPQWASTVPTILDVSAVTQDRAVGAPTDVGVVQVLSDIYGSVVPW